MALRAWRSDPGSRSFGAMQQIRTGGTPFELVTPGTAVLAPQPRGERGFWLALALAVLLHMSFFVGLWKAPVRYVGDPAGSVEGIDVDLVDASELASRMQGAAAAPPPSPPVPQMEPSQPAEPATAAPPPPPTATASLQQPSPPVDRASAPPEAAKPAEPPPAEKAPEKAEQQEPAETPQPRQEARKEPPPEKPPPPAEEINLADLLKPQISSLPPTPKVKESKDKERSKERERQKERQKEARAEPAPARPRIDFSPPSSTSYSLPGGGAGVSRPPGITRSGENDDFARGVVAALRRTMPDQRQRFGRVTIRLILNEIGNVHSIELLSGSGTGSLDQDVQFAARQSNFPLPPRNAPVVDRTFQITYIYR